jgi:alpha-amylase
LADWKGSHPDKKIDDAPFWMTGEYWGHGPERSKLHDAGFDTMINFEFQGRGSEFAQPDNLFARYASLQAGKPAQMLNYISSHDTKLFDRDALIDAGNALLLAPGGVQIFYGDETARPPGPVPSSDPQQATRSDMNWDRVDAKVLDHWRKLGSFRARHAALARGTHQRLSEQPYIFARTDMQLNDRVVVALNVLEGSELPVGQMFVEGAQVRNAYNGETLTVHNGKVRTTRAEAAVLLELVN